MGKAKPYAKLRGVMAEKGMTQKTLATMLGVSVVSVNNKLTGKTEFSPRDMRILKVALDLNSIDDYFFAE